MVSELACTDEHAHTRSAWDGRPLAVLTRTAPARATGAHVAIIGHITHTELRRYASAIEIANGLLNSNADPAGMPTSVWNLSQIGVIAASRSA